ncbi:MAG TPA: UDP-N-acetylmuramate dehydrogenase [Candidatus Cybelea sp.]
MSATTARATASLLRPDDREALRGIFGERVRFDEPLAPYTSWKIGGPADAFVTACDDAELAQLLRFGLQRRMPSWILGGGSNVLVGDGGVRGIVVRLAGEFAAVHVRGGESEIVVDTGGSADMALVTAKAASAGAAGVDSLAGIPGTVGGSLRMNAGTDREIGDFVRTVWVQSPSRPEPHAVDVRYLYRRSTLERDVIVSRVTLAFARREVRGVREDMQTRLIRRKQTQPVALPNAGSCFRNPDGDKAARLIESVGAKGWREGGAEVSPLHANFINNVGGATAKDVATLLARVRRAVRDRCGVELQLEVHLVGVFIDAT